MAINQAPIAVLNLPTTAKVGERVPIDPTRSTDPDGQIANHDLNFGDGVIKASPLAVVEHIYAKPGAYPVVLTVRDRSGKTNKVTKILTVTDDVVVDPDPPTITQQPYSQTIVEGMIAVLAVEATGEGLAFQWYRGSGSSDPIPGATASAYTTPPLTISDAFWVRVSNAAGAVDSTVAAITVIPDEPDVVAPTITAQPQSQTVGFGLSATLLAAATGTAPLLFEWFDVAQPAVVIATGSTFTTPALTVDRQYRVRVSNAAGAVMSATATITVIAIVPAGVLPFSAIRFKGYLRTPGNTSFAFGGLTGRRVNGQLRLIYTGSEPQSAPIYEIAVPTTLGTAWQTAPIAPLVRDWGTGYREKRGSWRMVDGVELWDPFEPNKALNVGHLYVPGRGLYLTYNDGYNTTGFPDYGCVLVELNDDGTTATYGPFRFKARDGQGVFRYGPDRAKSLYLDPATGHVYTSSTIDSGNARASWGMNLERGLVLPTKTSDPRTDIVLGEHLLGYEYMGGLHPDGSPMITDDGFAPHGIKSFRRRDTIDMYAWEPIPNQMRVNVNPALNGGVGSWGEMDTVGGHFIIGSTVIFVGSMCNKHEWYKHPEHAPVCFHGLPGPLHPQTGEPINNTGPVSTGHFSYMCAYDLNQLNQVAAGLIPDYSVEPLWFKNLQREFGLKAGHEAIGGGLRSLYMGHFDAATRTLYCLAQRADEPREYASLIVGFEIDVAA